MLIISRVVFKRRDQICIKGTKNYSIVTVGLCTYNLHYLAADCSWIFIVYNLALNTWIFISIGKSSMFVNDQIFRKKIIPM